MMRLFEITFYGRTKGAIGVHSTYTERVEAFTFDEARIKLYDSYENVMVKKFEEVEQY